MEYKQHSLYQMGPSLFFSLALFIFLAFTNPILVVVPILYALMTYLRWQNYRVVLEDNKLVLGYGVFSTHREQIRIDKIQKVRISRSFIQSAFKNLGTITLETGNDLTVELKNVENCQELYSELEKRTDKNA